MKCWICKSEATSGEHHIKKSDLKLLYPYATQKKPIYCIRNGKLQKKIGGIKSKSFMFDSLLCKECNNHRTQPHDKAWERLSSYLYKNWMKVQSDGYIDLYDVFRSDYIHEMLQVQLFFTKIFGCKISESLSPIDLNIFSQSILDEQEHPYLYISIRKSMETTKGNRAVLSDIEICTENEKTIYAHLFYTIGNVTVDMIYCPDESMIDLNGAKKTSDMKKILKLSKLNYNQQYTVCQKNTLRKII